MSNSTTTIPVGPNPQPYIEHEFTLPFLPSIAQSLLFTLFAELGDKTFIMLIILQTKTNKTTIFFASLIVEILMNILSMFLGRGIEMLLYKNLIDYLGMIIFILYGLWLLGENITKNGQTFFEDLKPILDEKGEIKKDKSKIKNSEPLDVIYEEPTNEKIEETDPLKSGIEMQDMTEALLNSKICNKKIKKEDKDEQDNGVIDLKYFWAIMTTMMITECGDRTQFSSMAMAALYNFYGVLVGSCSALFISIILGVYLGTKICKILNEKGLNIILGFVLLSYAGQMIYSKITAS